MTPLKALLIWNKWKDKQMAGRIPHTENPKSSGQWYIIVQRGSQFWCTTRNSPRATFVRPLHKRY